MKSITGQVVFYAAAPGQVAYDDDGNGVFTKAVLDGLACSAGTSRHVVTVGTLRKFVEQYVHDWVKNHRNPSIGAATQIWLDGDTERMPLACCGAGCGTTPRVAAVKVDATTIVATTVTGEVLWRQPRRPRPPGRGD